ncbi:3-oxoacyl-[acyl-carrier-protein] synthase III C-terminal domain-containing protein [Glaciimonas sp. GG7]
MNNSYIVGINSVIAPSYNPVEIINMIYPPAMVSERTNQVIKKLARQVGIRNRSTVRDTSRYPELKLLNTSYSSKEWGKKLIREVTHNSGIEFDDIGFLSVSYNASSHQEFIPNLACQIAQDLQLNLNSPPEVLPYLGCGGGMFAIQSAIEYCKKNNKTAVVFIFDQCSWTANPIYDKESPNFKRNLRSNLLFNDGGVAVLIAPDCLLSKVKSDIALKIRDINVGYSPGAAISMVGTSFLVDDGVEEVMPKLVSSKSVMPLLLNNHLSVQDIDEWSIHQGDIPILNRFKEIDTLGLTEKDIEASKNLFENFGNFSSPSVFFILEHFFHAKKNAQSTGVAVSFGAGYYYGSLLYERTSLIKNASSA